MILVLYAALALAYSTVNPPFESPDEIHHDAYVDFLLREHRLPVAEQGGPESEFHSPPLYYLLGSLVTAPLGSTRAPYEAAQRNPFWNFRTDQPRLGNKNQFIHGPAETFPYRDWVLRLHLVRLLSIALEAVTVLATYLIGREIFPDQPAIRLGALAFVAFLPQFLFIAGSVSNDNLVVPVAALLTWLLVRMVRLGITLPLALGCGILVGLSLESDMIALAMVPLVVVTMTLVAWRDRAWARLALAACAVIGLGLLLAGPIMMHNVLVYGEPTGLRRMAQIWDEDKAPGPVLAALRELPNVWSSFVARFGYGQIPVPDGIYIGFLLLSLFAALGLVLWFIRERRKSPSGVHRHSAVTIWQILLLVVVVLVWILAIVGYIRVSKTAANGRFLFMALPAFALLLFLGLSAWVPRRWHGALAGIANVAMFTFAVGTLLFSLRPAYASPPLLKAGQVPATARHGDVLIDGTLRLVAYDLPQEAVRPGEQLPVTVYWQSIAATPRDLSAFVHLWGRDMTLVGLTGTYLGLGSIPTSVLKPEDIVKDTYQVPVEISATTPSLLQVQVGLFEYGGGNEPPLPAVDSAGKPSNGIIGTVRLLPQQRPSFAPSHADRFDLAGKATLLGYDLAPALASPGDPINLALYWQAQSRMAEDYQVFIHLLGPIPTEERVAQVDRQPLAGNWPTSAWEPGYPLQDTYSLSLPADLRPGTYEVRAGLYRLSDGWRVPVQGPEGRVKESTMVLGRVEVR